MELNRFFLELESLTARVKSLDGVDPEAMEPQSFRRQTAAAFSDALEELRVADEELRVQNDALIESRYAVEVNQRRYQELFEFAPDSYLLTSSQGIIREANLAASTLLGLSQRLLAGKPLANFVSAASRREFRAALANLENTPGLRFGPVRLLPRGGEPLLAELTASVGRDYDGELLEVRWLIRQTAHRAEPVTLSPVPVPAPAQEAPPAPVASEGRMTRLIQGIDAIVWESDATGRVQFISQRAEEILGYPAASWPEEPRFWEERIYHDDRHWAAEARRLCLVYGNDRELEYRMVTIDGRVIWFRESIRAVRDSFGGVIGLRGTLWNIGRRKKVERKLYYARRELAERLEDITYLDEVRSRLLETPELVGLIKASLDGFLAALGSSAGMVLLHEPGRDRQVLAASVGLPVEYIDRYGDVAARSESDEPAAGSFAPSFVGDYESDEVPADWRERAKVAGFRSSFTVPIRRRSGEPLGLIRAGFAEPHRPAPRQARVAELLASQAAVLIENAQLLEEARSADRTKEHFLGLLGHELRNPLSAILGAAQSLDEDNVEAARGIIERQARQMGRLIGGLLDAARARHGSPVVRKRTIDLAEVVARAIESLRPAIEAMKHTLTVALPGDPVLMEGDPDRLRQLLENLLANAVNYTSPGGRINLTAVVVGDSAEIEVEDNGIGIAPELLPRVFDLSIRGQEKSNRVWDGLGIGLSLAKDVAEQHGGGIKVRSEGPGMGSVFTVRIPLGRVAPRVIDPPDTVGETGPPLAPIQPRRVMLLDDDPDVAAAISTLARRRGHDVHVAPLGEDALLDVEVFRPEVIFVDLRMPGIDGFEFARILKDGGRTDCLIVAITGYDREEDRRRSFESGFDRYLVKPVEADEILRVIEGE